MKSVKTIKVLYNSPLPNKDVDNTFSNDLGEIYRQKNKNFKNTITGHQILIL